MDQCNRLSNIILHNDIHIYWKTEDKLLEAQTFVYICIGIASI